MNATTSAPARQRKPRPKPQRFIRIEVRPGDNGGLGIVRITVGKEHADCFLTELPADFSRGCTVEKIGLHCDEPPHHVNIDTDKKSCECKGFLKWGHCKHADGLAALIAAGRL
jgi:hypothetical protein